MPAKTAALHPLGQRLGIAAPLPGTPQRARHYPLVDWPQSPNMSAHAECFNRILQEPFADCHEALLFSDLAENRKLAEWLLDYNKSCPILASARHYKPSFNINPSAIGGGPGHARQAAGRAGAD